MRLRKIVSVQVCTAREPFLADRTVMRVRSEGIVEGTGARREPARTLDQRWKQLRKWAGVSSGKGAFTGRSLFQEPIAMRDALKVLVKRSELLKGSTTEGASIGKRIRGPVVRLEAEDDSKLFGTGEMT